MTCIVMNGTNVCSILINSCDLSAAAYKMWFLAILHLSVEWLLIGTLKEDIDKEKFRAWFPVACIPLSARNKV